MNSSPDRRRGGWLLRLLPLVALFLASAMLSETRLPTGKFRDRDPTQHFVYAYNLAKHSAFSLDRSETPPLTLDRMRGPAYPALLSLAFRVFEEPAGADLECYLTLEGPCREHHAKLRRINQLAFLALLALACLIALELTGSVIAATGVGLAVDLWLLPSAGAYRAEVLSATLLLIHAYCLLRLVQGRGRTMATAAIAGLAGGLLPLCQAASIFWTLSLALTPAAALVLRRKDIRTASPSALMLMAAIALSIAGGWMTRNAIQTGSFSISGRGSSVLAVRAEFSSMSWDEYLAAWKLFSPLASELAIHLDLSETPNAARFSRTNPDGFYQRVRFLFMPLNFPLQAIKESQALAGMERRNRGVGAVSSRLEPDETASDASLRRASLEVMRENWVMHFALIPTLASRGLRLQLPMLLVALGVVVWRRDLGMAAFLAPALYSVAFHAAVTHYISRYGDPLLPVIAIAFAWALTGSSAAPAGGVSKEDEGEPTPAG